MQFIVIAVLLNVVSLVCGSEYLVRVRQRSIASFLDSTLLNLRKVNQYVTQKNINNVYQIGGFSCLAVDGLSQDVVEMLRQNPFVMNVVPNLQVQLYDKEEDDEDDGEEESEDKTDKLGIQFGAPRHLGRLSSRGQLPYNMRYENEFKELINYYYEKDFMGEDVVAYIMDTGVYSEHEEFEGRVIQSVDFTGEGVGDQNGHGTHVAGIVGSKTFGVAKKVSMKEVKVLDGKGTGNLTSVLSGLEWVVKDCNLQQNATGAKKCVANLSLGTIRNNIINDAVEEAYKAGVVLVVAAGNSNISACWTSPASAKNVITVGAFDDRSETIAFFSNWGACVDLFAPGVRIKSLSNIKEEHQKHTLNSGTSMASPIITGLVAILMNKGYKQYEIKNLIVQMATKNAFSKMTLFLKYGTPNKVAYNGIEDYIDQDDYEDQSRLQSYLNRLKYIYSRVQNGNLAKLAKTYGSTGQVKVQDGGLSESIVAS